MVSIKLPPFKRNAPTQAKMRGEMERKSVCLRRSSGRIMMRDRFKSDRRREKGNQSCICVRLHFARCGVGWDFPRRFQLRGPRLRPFVMLFTRPKKRRSHDASAGLLPIEACNQKKKKRIQRNTTDDKIKRREERRRLSTWANNAMQSRFSSPLLIFFI